MAKQGSWKPKLPSDTDLESGVQSSPNTCTYARTPTHARTARAHALLLPGQVSTAVAAGVSTAAGLLTASQRHPQLLEALADQAYGVYDWAADHVPLLGTYPRLIGLGLGGLSAGGALYYMRWVDVSWAWGWGGCVVGLGLGWMSAGGALTRITCGGRMCRSGG